MGRVRLADRSSLILVANNNDRLRCYRTSANNTRSVTANKDETYAIIRKKDGSYYKHEFYHGSGYLSASSRIICLPDPAVKIDVFNSKGIRREITGGKL